MAECSILRTDRYHGHPIELFDFKGGALKPSPEPAPAVSLRVNAKPLDRYRRLLRELRAAGGFLEHEFPRQSILLIAQRHFEVERIGREFYREVKRTFGQQQVRNGYPRWHFEVLEATCGVHSNIVGPLSLARAEELLEYSFKGVPYGKFIDIQQIVPARGGMRGLIGYGLKNPGYLGKELGRKHVLGVGGGDKIRFSKNLREELVGRDLIEDRRRVYASRSLPHVGPKKQRAQTSRRSEGEGSTQ